MNDFPIQITEKALKQLITALSSDPELTPEHFIRISCKGGGCKGYQFELDFDDELDIEEDQFTILNNDDGYATVVIDEFSKLYMQDVVLDYQDDPFKSGFKFSGSSTLKNQCGCGNSFG